MQVLAKTLDLDRVQWLDLRKKGIGGSDASAVAGVSRYRTDLQVFMEKTGQLPDEAENDAMYWGTILEEIVAREFERRTDKKVRRKNAILQHPKHTFMLANVDREVVGEKAILECKTANQFKTKEWDDNIPDEYLIQLQHYLAVTGYEKGYIAVLIGGQRFLWQEVKKDQEIVDYLIKLESEFWNNHVKTGIPPVPTPDNVTNALLKLLYPKAQSETSIVLPDTAQELIQTVQRYASMEKEAKKNRERYENQLKALIGENEAAFCGNFKIDWKNVNTNRLDTKKLKAEQGDIYSQYVSPSSYRKLAIKEMKGA